MCNRRGGNLLHMDKALTALPRGRKGSPWCGLEGKLHLTPKGPLANDTPAHPPSLPNVWYKAHFFLSELSVSGGMPTTVTVPCSTFSGAAITKGSNLQRRFFVCKGTTPSVMALQHECSTRRPGPDRANRSLPKGFQGLLVT